MANIAINELSDEFVKLLEKNPSLVFTDSGRIKCTLTNHEMPIKLEPVLQHTTAKKYLKLSKNISEPFSYEDYEPYLTKSSLPGHKNKLLCNLTLRLVNKQPDHVLRHVSGKRFQKAKKRWDDCEKNGKLFVATPLLSKLAEVDDVEEEESEDETDVTVASVENGDDQVEKDDSSHEMEVVKKNKKAANGTKKSANGVKKAANGTKKAANETKKSPNGVKESIDGVKNISKNEKKRKQCDAGKEKSSKKSKADLIVFQ